MNNIKTDEVRPRFHFPQKKIGLVSLLLLYILTSLSFNNVLAADYVRMASASAGKISDVASTFLSTSNIMVSAVKNGNGNLKLISWRVGSNGNSFQRLNSKTAGKVSQIEIVPLRNNNLVTAVRDGAGNLKLIRWTVNYANGQISRSGEALAGAVRNVKVISLDYGSKLLTAVRDGSGNLKLISWDVSNHGQINRLGEKLAGKVTQIALMKANSHHSFSSEKVITAIRDSGGKLKLIAWQTFLNGQIERLGSTSAGTVKQVASSNFYGDLAIVAVRDHDNNLKVISWEFDGQSFKRLYSRGAGKVSDIELFPSRPDPITVVRDSTGNLRLIEWDVETDSSSSNFGRFSRQQTITAGAVRNFSASYGGYGLIVISLQDGNGNLKLIAWDNCENCTPVPLADDNADVIDEYTIICPNEDCTNAGCHDPDTLTCHPID